MSATSPVWIDLLAETIPPHRTGRLFGYRRGLSAILGLFAGPVCAFALASLAFPHSYAVLYVAGFAVTMLSWLFFALVDEMPADVVPRARQRAVHYFRDLLSAVRRDAGYRRFLCYRALSHVGVAAVRFFAVVAAVYHGASEAVVVGSLIVARRLAIIVGTFFGPLLAERVGHRRVMQIGTAMVACAIFALALLPKGALYAYIAIVFVRSLVGTARGVSQAAFALRVYPRGMRVGYSTLSTVALALTGMVAGPAAGWLMDSVGHKALFMTCAAATLLALLPLRGCRADHG
jgi:MFS family permease